MPRSMRGTDLMYKVKNQTITIMVVSWVRCVLVFHPEMIANTRMLHEVIRQWLRFHSFTQRHDIVRRKPSQKAFRHKN